MNSEAENSKQSHPIQKALLTFNTVMGTVFLLFANSLEKDDIEADQKPSLSIVKSVHMYFTVCEKNIQSESYIYAVEYILFYFPMVWILVNIVRQNYTRDGGKWLYVFNYLV